MSAGPSIPVDVVFVLFLSLEVLISLFLNMFITSGLLWDYYLKKKLTPVQKIQAALNASSAFFIVVSSFHVFADIFPLEFSRTLYYNIMFTFLFIFCMCSSSFLTAFLCSFYFIKVVNAQSWFLGWVKKKISSTVHWQIALATLSSLLNSSLSLFLYDSDHIPPTNGSFILPASVTLGQARINYSIAKLALIMISIPLLTTALTTLLTVGFLKIHGHKMKNTWTSGESSLTLYKRVIYKMMRFLVLDSVFYLVIFLYYFSVFYRSSPGYYMNLVLMFLLTPTQSALHILDNPNLRSTWKKMVGCLMRLSLQNV